VKKGLARIFARDRRHRAERVDSPIASVDIALVHDAEVIVHRAWLSDLLELRSLAEDRLQTAVDDGLRAYEALQRAQRGRQPRSIVDAQVLFEVATTLTWTRTADLEKVRELIHAESEPVAAPAAPTDGEPGSARSRRLTVVIGQLSRITARRGQR
jgi:hypothetical protein